ncbi:MAG TPA: isoaspartyl peptidase/L-asparaginase [Opitutaceae bacterium]|nr:isoaspartyl peptidase/L-asparaginase [Opitutaceae bacterium]
MKPRYGLVIHGGAGTILRSELTPELEAEYTAALSAALDAGYAVLNSGGTALDAVVATIRILEDSPLFNAARGAVMTADGVCELDASIMNGIDRSAGAVAGVRRVRNPIVLARDVMERSKHVMLTGEGAERFAVTVGHELVENSYFQTELRRRQLEQAKEIEARESKESAALDEKQPAFSEFVHKSTDDTPDRKFGTVGCVALDQHGNLAAGTSTGGMMNKRFGRVGDSPIIGAGTYADNGTCAVSSTGHGEYYIRAVAAHDIASRVRYAGDSLPDAARKTIDELGAIGGTGGVIAIDRTGAITAPFNTPGMYRGWRLSDGETRIAIYAD